MTLTLPMLRPDQARIAKHPAKIKVWAAGRRVGKTILGGRLVMETLRQHGRAAWIAPTYKNTRPLWRWCVQVAAGEPRLTVSTSERTITTDRGGFLGIYSGDNIDSIRGEAFHLAVLDEAAMLGPDAWTDAIMPTLADYDGDALLISTPKGHNWFWQEWLKSQADGKRMMAWQSPTSDNPMPTIRKAAELARERVSSRTYEQEWLAEFVDDGGGVFRRVREAATAVLQDARMDGHQYIMGVDWGRTNDATVFTVIDATLQEVCAVDRMTDTDYRLQVGRLRALTERFDVAQIVAEANSMGGPLIEQLLDEGLPVVAFTTSNASKGLIIDALALAFERGTLRIPDDARLLGELQAYESERLPGGMIRYSAPDGMHDDYVMSLALAWSGAATANTEYMRFIA
jgi:phage terminase large subunit-like protein